MTALTGERRTSPNGNSSHAELGKRLREFRMERGLSQDYMGKVIGITGSQYQKWEMGINRIPAVDLNVIAEKFGVEIAVFFKKAKAK